MTLKTLLSTTPFVEMIPYLESMFSRKFSHSQIGYCRMAYDELQHVRPKYLGYSMRIVMRDFGNGKGPELQALDIEGMPWNRCLGYEMEVADDVTASNAEIAAQCLWGLTFYGYSRSRRPIFLNSDISIRMIAKESGIKWDKYLESYGSRHDLVADEVNSRYCGKQNRIDYISEIAEKYMAVNFSDADHLNFNVYVPESEPLTEDEKKRLFQCARAILPSKDCNFNISIISQNRKSHYVNMIIYTFKRKQA